MRRFQVPSLGFFVVLMLLLGLAGGLQFANFTSHAVLASGACNSTRSSNDSDEQTVISLINAWRTSNNLPALAPTAGLTRAAISKSTEMAATATFAHDDILTTMQRFNACGNGSTSIGENIAAGNMDPASTFGQWKSSAEHNANMLGSNFRAIGIGRAVSSSGYPYWTTELGNVVDSAVTGSNPLPGRAGQPSLPTTVPTGGPVGLYGQGFFPGAAGNLPCFPASSVSGQASTIGFGFFGSGATSCSFPLPPSNLQPSNSAQGFFPGGQPLPFNPPPASAPSNVGEGFFP